MANNNNKNYRLMSLFAATCSLKRKKLEISPTIKHKQGFLVYKTIKNVKKLDPEVAQRLP